MVDVAVRIRAGARYDGIVSDLMSDLADRTLAWDPSQPYLLRKDPVHGYCVHQGGDGACTICDERPGTCRAYDCRQDPRVWSDFERRIPAPLPFHLVPPEARVAPATDDEPR